MPLQKTAPFSWFPSKWTHITEPGYIKTVLDSINIPQQQQTYNELLLAYDPTMSAYYGVYGASSSKDSHGRVTFDPKTVYKLIYDRGDLPNNFKLKAASPAVIAEAQARRGIKPEVKPAPKPTQPIAGVKPTHPIAAPPKPTQPIAKPAPKPA